MLACASVEVRGKWSFQLTSGNGLSGWRRLELLHGKCAVGHAHCQGAAVRRHPQRRDGCRVPEAVRHLRGGNLAMTAVQQSEIMTARQCWTVTLLPTEAGLVVVNCPWYQMFYEPMNVPQ